MASTKKHLDELLKLPRAERSAAAETLLISLEEEVEDTETAAAWIEEIERRVAEDAPGISAEEVFREGRERHQRTP